MPEMLCFTVEGEFLTDFSRQQVIEGNFDKAIETLECLEGMTIDQMLQVLRGDAKLTGDSNVGVGMEEDDATEYKEELKWFFGGVWNNNGRYMRPYAAVTAWSRDDMVPDGKYIRHNSLYYARDPYSDVDVRLKMPKGYVVEETDVLWEEIPKFPHLLHKAIKDPQEALDDFFATGRGLPETGHEGGRSAQREMIDIEGTTTPDRAFDLLDGYRQKIVEQAGDNWIQITDEVKVPRAPFEHWCLWRGDGAHLAMPWETVCPSGMKMMGDDPYHTDFMVGAGLDLNYDNQELTSAFYDKRREVQQEKLGFECAVLCGTGTSETLVVVHPKKNEPCLPNQVAVIPNAGPDYVEAAMTAGAVITEQGGQMAHLVTVSREKDVKIIRVDKARKLYPEGMHLVVDCSKGKVKVPYTHVDNKMKLGGEMLDLNKIG